MNLHYKKSMIKTDTNFAPSKVEKAGYISTQKQIEALIYSGRKLSALRRGEFDFNGDEELDETKVEIERDIDDLAVAGSLLQSIAEKGHSGNRVSGKVPESDNKGNDNGNKDVVVDESSKE